MTTPVAAPPPTAAPAPGTPPADAPKGLPFDIRTLLLSIWQRKYWGLLGFVGAVAAGIFVSAPLASRTWKTNTIVMFTATPSERGGFYKTPALKTQISMVKLPANMREVARRVGGDVSPSALAKAIDVTLERKTSLVTMTVVWDSPTVAAAIVNNARDVFLESGVKLRQDEARRVIRGYEVRYAAVNKQLAEADRILGDFTKDKNIVSVTKEIEILLTQRMGVAAQLNKAESELRIARAQFKELDTIMAKIEKQLEKEKVKNREMEDLTHVNIRAERLKELITEGRRLRVREAQYKRMVDEFARKKREYEAGHISQADFETARMDFEVTKANFLDTEQIKAWQKELAGLDEVLVPKDDAVAASAPLLMDYFRRSLDLQLNLVSVVDKVALYEDALATVDARIAALPAIQKQYLGLARNVTALERETRDLERKMASARDLAQLETPDFAVLSEAVPPDRPSKSTRKLVAIAVTMLLSMGVFGTIVLRTVLDSSLKSAGEAKAKFKLPVLGELPTVSRKVDIIPETGELPLMEEFRYIAHRIRKMMPRKGARLLVVSALQGEGRSSIAAQLAVVWGRQDERVAVLDAQIRQPHDHPLDDFLAADFVETDEEAVDDEIVDERLSLGGYLSFGAEMDEVSLPTVFPGVELIASNGHPVTPDMLQSRRMSELLDALSNQFSLVVLDSPPLGTYTDAIVLADRCDAVFFVVRAGNKRPRNVNLAISRLRDTGVPLLGMVVNDVHRLYLEKMA